MNVLIIGNGGRENAIAWSVYASPLLGKLFCMPGNPGIADYATCIDGNILDNNEVYKCILEYSIDVVIVGPETPLVNGIVDFLENKNIQTRPIFSGNILRHPAFENLISKKNKINNLKNSDYIMKYGLLIGCHQGLNISKIN